MPSSVSVRVSASLQMNRFWPTSPEIHSKVSDCVWMMITNMRLISGSKAEGTQYHINCIIIDQICKECTVNLILFASVFFFMIFARIIISRI